LINKFGGIKNNLIFAKHYYRTMKKIKSLFVLALLMVWRIIKAPIMGRIADAVCDYDYEVGGTVCYPINQPSFNDWCKEMKVSSRVPKSSYLF
jgi:hypothetical protein